MKKEIADRWVKALRSGQYRQGTDYLHNPSDGTYCCLGVLCTLYDEDAGADNEVAGTWGDGHEILPEEIRDWADMGSEDGSVGSVLWLPGLAALNDGVAITEKQEKVLNDLDALPDGYEPYREGGPMKVKLSFEEIANVIEAEYDQL